MPNGLPLSSCLCTSLARPLQPDTATQLTRRPTPDQPRSQRLWVGQLAEHEAALRQTHGIIEEGTIVERRAATARRVFEPTANDLCALDCIAQNRELLFGDVTQLLRCRTIPRRRPKQ